MAVLLLLIFLWPSQTFAYIDPGSGSFLIQAIITSILGVIYLIKNYFKK